MEVMINQCFGGFAFSDDFKKEYPMFLLDSFETMSHSTRCNTNIIKAVKEYGYDDVEGKYKASGNFSDIAIIDVDDGATDWDIVNYDGMESIVYVIDGKLRYIDSDEIITDRNGEDLAENVSTEWLH